MAPHEHDAAAPVHHHDEEDAPVSRATQAGIGLFTAVFFFGAALGGLFSLAFAFVQGRMSRARPRATAAAIAVVGWAAVSLVPALKYPANPPAVGDPGTIGLRTAVFFGMIGLSLVAVLAAAALRSRLLARLGAWDATIVSGVAYAVLMAIAWLALPALNEVPAGYPADLLWQFRLVSFGAQFLLWTTIGLVFGWLVERERAAARLLSARG
jgi:hypothetical protein